MKLKNNEKGCTLPELTGTIVIAGIVVVIIGIIYSVGKVAHHFIMKFW